MKPELLFTLNQNWCSRWPGIAVHLEPEYALLDADHFKQVNDNFGHPAGDAYLRHVAKVLKSQIRESDILARLGGDEFICIFPRTSLESAQLIAEKMRDHLRISPLQFKGYDIPISFSFGIAEIATGQRSDDLISAADAQLYRAKESGRNKVASALAVA